MKAIDVRKKSPDELQKLLQELQGDLREFRFGMSGGRTKNVKKARSIRADIARIHTVLSEKTK
jgi:ribosomal protein L29